MTTAVDAGILFSGQSKCCCEEEVALLSIYVALGFFSTISSLDAEADDHGGHIGAASRCVEVAQELAAAVVSIQSTWPEIEYPGVLAYEVAENAGSRLRAAGWAGDRRDDLVEELVTFFKPDDRTNTAVEVAALRRIVSAALRAVR